jgi:tetratricopeptide (TPR) repeat protein
MLGRALELARAAGERGLEGVTLSHLAIVYEEDGRGELAIETNERGLAIHREVGNRVAEGTALANLANLHLNRGRLADARELYRRALAIHREVGNVREEGVTLTNLARVFEGLGDPALARDLFDEGLALHRRVGNLRCVGVTFVYRAALERRAGAHDVATSLVGEAERIFGEIGEGLYSALCECERGHLALADGRDATAHDAAARALVADLGITPDSELGRAVTRLGRAIEAARVGGALVGGECAEGVS